MAPLYAAENGVPIEGRYIVVLKDSGESGALHVQESFATHTTWLMSLLNQDPSSSLLHVYDLPSLMGYAGVFTEETLSQIRANDAVDFVEQDQIMGIDWNNEAAVREGVALSALNFEAELIEEALGKKPPKQKPKPKPQPPSGGGIETQSDAPWGLSRVSSRTMPSDMSKYSYPASAGQDVDVYVVDTGINVDHSDFQGRAIWGKTIPQFDQDIDGNGHGTHVAGTIASKSYGLAKKAKVIAVKVLRTSGYGSNADVISGVEWVIQSHKSNSLASNGHSIRKSIANMSLGGGRSPALDKAVNAAVISGVHFAVAAGNDSADACNYSPAAAEKPVTVGASTIKDDIAYFSNHGSCVDIFAPGLDITSTWIGGTEETKTISGTSMASPHVAGVMALYLGEKNYTTTELKELIMKDASEGLLKGLPANTVNSLLNINGLIDAKKSN